MEEAVEVRFKVQPKIFYSIESGNLQTVETNSLMITGITQKIKYVNEYFVNLSKTVEKVLHF
jgi:hypothetical protein